MAGLITHHFLFTTEVVTPIELDEHSGAALRGSLFEAVWKRFCTNKASPTCAACPLHTVCPVSALVAPLREEHPRGTSQALRTRTATHLRPDTLWQYRTTIAVYRVVH